jgi:hypothetical protein
MPILPFAVCLRTDQIIQQSFTLIERIRAFSGHCSKNAGWIGAGNLGEREWTIEVPEV